MSDEDDTGTDFNGMTDLQLKEMVVRNCEQIHALKADAKEYASGIRATVKELDNRNKAAIEELEVRNPK